VGIGINLTSEAFSPELHGIATSVESATGKRPNAEPILEGLVNLLTARYQMLEQRDGPEATVREWCARSTYATGKRIRVSENSKDFSGITRGLEPDGALRVETDESEIRVVRAGDVTLVRPAG
jgi:BirA family biotin operon repressor/biotin-[acetyl-CoA-carboxylase] ligase